MYKKMLIISFLLMSSVFAENEQLIKAHILSNVTQTAPDAEFYVAVQFDISDGSYTYWENPGDAGVAPTFSWTAPENVVIGKVMFPSPKLKIEEGIVNYVYEKKVLFLFPVKIAKDYPAPELKLKVKADWLVCKEACIPESEFLELVIPVENEQKFIDGHNVYFDKWRKKVPFQNDDLAVLVQLNGKALSITGKFKDKVDEFAVFPLTEELLIDQKKGKINDDGSFSQNFIVDIPVSKADFVLHLRKGEKHYYITKTITVPKQQ